eukprot:Skav220307  [mRNA]  locus=scaffold525:48864:56053:+ [translate_table: standard]
MRSCCRVLVLTAPRTDPDHSADTLERCWVVFEAALAHELGKERWEGRQGSAMVDVDAWDYNICLPDDGDAASWRIVGRKLEKLDVEACKASDKRDKEEILSYIRRRDGDLANARALTWRYSNLIVHHLCNVRKLARQAMERDLDRIQRASPSELLNWRNIRGRTVTHVAAAASQAPVLALLALKADLELRSRETQQTALHLAAIRGHPEIMQAPGRLVVAGVGVSTGGATS